MLRMYTLTGFTVMFVTTAALVGGGCRPFQGSTDGELLQRFHEHRSELEQLIRMFQADKGLGRVGKNFTRPDDPSRVGVSFERISEYRRLCEVVGAAACIEGYDASFYRLGAAGPPPGVTEAKEPIWIIVSTSGLSFSGSTKGYLYSAAPTFEVVPDLDHHPSTVRSKTWIRHVEGPWYLFFDVRN